MNCSRCKSKRGCRHRADNPLNLLVGMRGFEPPASASRTLRSTKLSHIPKKVSMNMILEKCKYHDSAL